MLLVIVESSDVLFHAFPLNLQLVVLPQQVLEGTFLLDFEGKRFLSSNISLRVLVNIILPAFNEFLQSFNLPLPIFKLHLMLGTESLCLLNQLLILVFAQVYLLC